MSAKRKYLLDENMLPRARTIHEGFSMSPSAAGEYPVSASITYLKFRMSAQKCPEVGQLLGGVDARNATCPLLGAGPVDWLQD